MAGIEAVAATSALTWIMPSMIAGSLSNVLLTQHGNKFSVWWWKNLYLSNKYLFTLKESPMEYFIYFLTSLAIKTETLVAQKLIPEPAESREIQLDSTMLYLLSKTICPLRGHFFNQKGKCIRRTISVPSEPFFIDSIRATYKGKVVWTWLKVFPLSDGVHLLGFEMWTYQWFWGIQSNSPTTQCAKKMMIATVNDMKKFEGMDALVRLSAMAHGKLPPLTGRDGLGVKDYREFAASLMDPNYSDDDSLEDLIKTTPV